MQRFKSFGKTNAYGSRMIDYDIVPKNLSKMEQDFRL